MSAKSNAPIIVKRKKVIAGGGHHGGAWKVAYADFVTAMMAFFMLMWLLNATTEQQRKGLADYFAPTVAVSRTSGGADGNFGGTDVMSDDTLVRSNRGGGFTMVQQRPDSGEDEGARLSAIAAEVRTLRDLEEVLLGTGGESLLSEQALRHVITKLTDEGLEIELFSLPDGPLFAAGTDRPEPVTIELLEVIARVIGVVPNDVAVAAHMPAQPVILADRPVWASTVERANRTRLVMEGGGLDPARMARVTGHGDQSPAAEDPLALRNERLRITILRDLD